MCASFVTGETMMLFLDDTFVRFISGDQSMGGDMY
jgi:hypothetical protein